MTCTLYLASIERTSTALLDDLYALSSPPRREAADRFRQRQDRSRCLVAGRLLRYGLDHSGFSTTKVSEVALGAFGKPYFEGASGPEFNISHSGLWVVCAMSDQPVGVDVETVVASSVDVARQFAPDELALVEQLSGDERTREATRLWTLKESYLKFLGRGLSVRLNSFSVAGCRPQAPGLDEDCWLHHRWLSDHSLAVCTRSDAQPLFRFIELDDLSANARW